MSTPPLVIFDVNETLSDLDPLRARLSQVGAPPGLLDTWFAATLRDGIALAAAGGYAGFRAIGLSVLTDLLARLEERPADPVAAAEHVLAGFAELDVHPDIPDGMRRLAAGGVRMATLSNGAAEVARTLLRRAGLAGLVEQTLSVDDAGRWKPAPDPYLFAARTCGVAPGECVLVAVHPWTRTAPSVPACAQPGSTARRGSTPPTCCRRTSPQRPCPIWPRCSCPDAHADGRAIRRYATVISGGVRSVCRTTQ